MEDFDRQRCSVLTVLMVTMLILMSGCQTSSNTSEVSETPTAQSTALPQPEIITEPDSTPLLPEPEIMTDPVSVPLLPQMDCSTARIPITNAIYELFTDTYGYEGPTPLSSKTHGAWLNLADGKADIIFLVAPTEEELKYFAEKAVDIEMKVYGYDGLVFIGNESNSVQNLTTQQIRDIYRGDINNWSDIGGEDADIIVYIRNQESGSQRLFESLVWNGYDMPDFSAMNFLEDEITPTVTQRYAQRYDGMGDITDNVLLNQYSIGFNIMSYIDSEFKDSTLKLFAVNGYMPTTENFASKKYPFLTTSYVAIRADEPADSPARQLYNWVSSEESYELISQNSTLTVAFSESIIIKAGMDLPAQAGDNISAIQNDIANMILKLDQQYIHREDLLPYTLDEIAYLRNGIYALSGKIFTTEKYVKYFSEQSWYQGITTSDSEIAQAFNDYQKKNMELILAYEKELQ